MKIIPLPITQLFLSSLFCVSLCVVGLAPQSGLIRPHKRSTHTHTPPKQQKKTFLFLHLSLYFKQPKSIILLSSLKLQKTKMLVTRTLLISNAVTTLYHSNHTHTDTTTQQDPCEPLKTHTRTRNRKKQRKTNRMLNRVYLLRLYLP